MSLFNLNGCFNRLEPRFLDYLKCSHIDLLILGFLTRMCSGENAADGIILRKTHTTALHGPSN